MFGMDSSPEEMGSTEDILLALLDFLVDPLLPSRSSSMETVKISPSQEESVAKQVHAVVLLYNYYHRKQHPGLSFLKFQSFCKLAMVLKPSLQLYFRRMQKTECAELDALDKDLSLTEKAIVNACETALNLDASNNNPIMDGWPVTKVAIFLVDSRKENCYLFHSSITLGVWSVIEKEVNVPNQGSAVVNEARSEDIRTQVVTRASKENQTANGTNLQQLAYKAVKETCGINQDDLKILESHLVYSTSKAKTAVCLYIIQCTQINWDVDLVPISDVIDSLQGPVVRKKSVTPVVEYFHLLPFADKVSGWLIRDTSKDSSQDFEEVKENGHCDSVLSRGEQLSDTSCQFEAVKKTENCTVPLSEEPLSSSEQKCTEEKPFVYISESFEATEARTGNICHVKKIDSTQYPEATEEVENNCSNRQKVDTAEPVVYKKRKRLQKNSSSFINPIIEESNGPTDYPRTCSPIDGNSGQETDQAVLTGGNIIVGLGARSDERFVKKALSGNKISYTVMSDRSGKEDCTLVPFGSESSDFENLRKIQLAIASKEKMISQAALMVLLRKREQLSRQHRDIADEIALCERNIQTIISGGEDDFAVKIDSIVKGCNEICLRTAGAAGCNTALQCHDQDLLPVAKKKRLFEAIMSVQSPCQELDDICTGNLWMYPTYSVRASEDGFQATVALEGADFRSSCEGSICTTPAEARHSAASNILVKLRSMVADL